MDAADLARLAPSSSSLSSSTAQTDIFQFELRSDDGASTPASSLRTQTALPAASANAAASKLPLPGHPADSSDSHAQSTLDDPLPSAAIASDSSALAPAVSSSSDAAREPACAHSQGIDMHLSKLPFRLVLLTFPVDHLPACTHAILHALMHPSNMTGANANSAAASASASSSSAAPVALPTAFRPNFFSFTQAGSEISLILEASCASHFPPHLVTQHHSVWCALEVSQGSDASDAASLVAPLSAILARHAHAIYYLSTASLDYILVAEQHVEDAIQVLSQSLSVMVDR